MNVHHHDHNHNHSHGKKTPFRALIISIILIMVFGVIEAIGGWLVQSLTLLSDAGHMGADGLSLMIAAFAAWVALKPASKKHSYGYGRAEILAAWFTSLILLAISITIIVEAIARIHNEPIDINGITVMIISALGIIINLLVAWILSRSEKNLNTRAALLHVLSDLMASFAALLSGAVIYFSGWTPIDPILSILIGILIMASSIRLLRESSTILMEGVPQHLDFEVVKQDMQSIDGVKSIHALHIWTLSSGLVALSAHIIIHDLNEWEQVLIKLKQCLSTQYNINHITLQPTPEYYDCKPYLMTKHITDRYNK